MTIPEEIEFLDVQLKLATEERDQAEILLRILKIYNMLRSAKSRPYIDSLLRIAENLNEPKYRAPGLLYLGVLKRHETEYLASIQASREALRIYESLNDKKGMAASYTSIGNVFHHQSDYVSALENHFKSLYISEELNDKFGLASSYNNIGVIYQNQYNYPEAVKSHSMSLRYREELGDKWGIALSYNNLGLIYLKQGNDQEALKNHFASLKIKIEIGDKRGMASSYFNIGDVYRDHGDHADAHKNYFTALKLLQELDDKATMAALYNEIGRVYARQNNFSEALKNQLEGYAIAQKTGHKESLKLVSQGLYETYKALGDSQNALKYYKKYYEIEKETLGEESQKQINHLNFIHNLEQKEKEAAYEKQRREEEEQLRIIVEQKNAELIQSINYALKIQTAILRSMEKIKRHFPDSFVLYLPKDIVSGDFYWLEEIWVGRRGTDEGSLVPRPSSPDPLILFAACDCSGHGVPGAMVSLVCHNALNRAVHEFGIIQPSLILDKVCELVADRFKTSDGDVKDGMDISLCAFDPNTKTLQWSGANNPLCVLRGTDIIEIKADKQPIGASDYGKKFTNHTFDLQAGDIIYLFTDGYADQFGGAGGKKLTRKKMKRLLESAKSVPVIEQGLQLRNFISEYKKDTFQVDDILVMGVKIN